MNESDPRSNVHYLGSSENKAWKKFRLVRDLNPWPLRYRCSACTLLCNVHCIYNHFGLRRAKSMNQSDSFLDSLLDSFVMISQKSCIGDFRSYSSDSVISGLPNVEKNAILPCLAIPSAFILFLLSVLSIVNWQTEWDLEAKENHFSYSYVVPSSINDHKFDTTKVKQNT